MVPFIFRTSLDINHPALPYLVLHSLLEEFLPPYYYSAASAPLQQFLLHARQFRNSAVKCSPSAIVKTHLQLVHGQDFKLDTSEVHFYVFGLFSFFFSANCVLMRLLIYSFQICCQSCFCLTWNTLPAPSSSTMRF